MITGVPFNDVYRCMGELMAAFLPPIETPLVVKLDEADFLFCSFMVQATYQSAATISDLVTIIAAYHCIFNP